MQTITRPPIKQPAPPDAKLVFKGTIFEAYQWQQKMYDGSVKTFEKLKRPDTTVIVPVTADGKIIMIKQQQPGKEESYDFPGGRLEEGEDALVGAKRELEEETGYSSDDFVVLDKVQPLTKIDWIVFVLAARNCQKKDIQQLDSGEKITVFEVTFDEMIDLLINGNVEEQQELMTMALQAKIFPEKMDAFKKILFG